GGPGQLRPDPDGLGGGQGTPGTRQRAALGCRDGDEQFSWTTAGRGPDRHRARRALLLQRRTAGRRGGAGGLAEWFIPPARPDEDRQDPLAPRDGRGNPVAVAAPPPAHLGTPPRRDEHALRGRIRVHGALRPGDPGTLPGVAVRGRHHRDGGRGGAGIAGGRPDRGQPHLGGQPAGGHGGGSGDPGRRRADLLGCGGVAGRVLSGVAIVQWNVITVSLRQRIIPDHLLGRVNSVYRFFGWGTISLGTLLGGVLVSAGEPFLGRQWALRAPFLLASVTSLMLFLVALGRLSTAKIEAAQAEGAPPETALPETSQREAAQAEAAETKTE